MRQVKCHYCLEKSEKSEMYCDNSKKPRKYYHHSCWPLELQEREQADKKRSELKILVSFIEEVHDLFEMPRQFYPFIQDIVGGTVRFQGPVQKHGKQGVGYDILLEAYKLSEDRIRWARQNKDFVGVFAELKYGLTIVKSNINQAMVNARRKMDAERRKEVVSVDLPYINKEITYKKKESSRSLKFIEE